MKIRIRINKDKKITVRNIKINGSKVNNHIHIKHHKINRNYLKNKMTLRIRIKTIFFKEIFNKIQESNQIF